MKLLDVSVLCVLVLLMVSVGLELEFRYFKELRQHVFSVLAVLLAEMILLPALRLLVSLAIQMPAHLRMGALLIAACPVGDIANFFTLVAIGNLALSAAINVISCLLHLSPWCSRSCCTAES
jgi:bile acid:Na+ symporter, BASS family